MISIIALTAITNKLNLCGVWRWGRERDSQFPTLHTVDQPTNQPVEASQELGGGGSIPLNVSLAAHHHSIVIWGKSHL